VYVDEAAKIQSKGMNNEFGLFVNRPFYVVSKLPMKRCLGLNGNNVVLQTKQYNRVTQQFFFDGETKTIKSNSQKDKSLHSTGGSVTIQRTTNRWY